MSEIFFVQPDWQLFTNINTLPQQAGVSRNLLSRLVAKELTDNALDAGAQVKIEHQQDEAFRDCIRVRDFGDGIPGDDAQVAGFFSIKRPLTSSKRFRLPSRGALGNGLRVVTATVYCTGGELYVSTRGRKLQILPQDDGTSQYLHLGSFAGEGTEVEVILPDNFFSEEVLLWAHQALEMNQGKIYEGLSSPHWYDSDSFYNLLLSVPEEIEAAVFLGYFYKMSASKVRKLLKDLTENFPDGWQKGQPLAQLSRSEADFVLGKMRDLHKALSVQSLGEVGTLENFEGYVKVKSTLRIPAGKGKYAAEIPVLLESFGRLGDARAGGVYVNKTPIIGEVDFSYYDKKIHIYGCGLNEFVDCPKLSQAPQIRVNLITPYMPIVSNGKEPDLSHFAEAIREAIGKLCRQLKKQEAQDTAPSQVLSKAPSQKKVVLEHLEPGIRKASGEGRYRYSLRQLYYVLRPLVQEHTGKELKYANFNTIITDYEFACGEDLAGVYRDERGTLLHPHTQAEIKLGTRTVERYHRPIFNFNKILYSEKEGFFEILKDAGFCEKHDCALLTSKGFASRAARDVIDLLANTEEELYFFCIHDADLSGTLIYQALQGATKARPERKVRIVNLGLEPWEGLDMNLEVERLEKRSSKTAAHYIQVYDQDPQEKKPFHFTDYQRWVDWGEWLKSFRIELNAMDTPTFIEWLDRKVGAYSIGKVVPPETYLQNEAEENARALFEASLREEIMSRLDLESLVREEMAKKFPELRDKINQKEFAPLVKKALEDMPVQSWSDSFKKILDELMSS